MGCPGKKQRPTRRSEAERNPPFHTVADTGAALTDAPPPKPRRRRRQDSGDDGADALASAAAAAAPLLAPAAAAALDPRALTLATAAPCDSAWRTYGARCTAGADADATTVVVHAGPPLPKLAAGGGTRVAARVAAGVSPGAAAAAAAAALDAVLPCLTPGTCVAVTGGTAGTPPPALLPSPVPIDFETSVRAWAAPRALPPAPLPTIVAVGTASPQAAGARSGNAAAGYSARAALVVGAMRVGGGGGGPPPPPNHPSPPLTATLIVTVDGGAPLSLPSLDALKAAPWSRYGLGVEAVAPKPTPGVGRVTFTPGSAAAGSIPSVIVLALQASPTALAASVAAGATLAPAAAAARRLSAAALSSALAGLKRRVPATHLLPTGERALLGALPLVASALAGVAGRAPAGSRTCAAVAEVVEAAGGAAGAREALMAALVDAVDANRAAAGAEEEDTADDDNAARRRRHVPRPLAVVAMDSKDDGDGDRGEVMWAPLASDVEW